MKCINSFKALSLIVTALSCTLNADFVENYNNKQHQPFYVSADYLFWKAQQDQLNFAIAVPGGVNAESFLFADSLITLDMPFKGTSGVRTHAGFTLCNDWEIGFSWTSFRNYTAISKNIPNGILATAIFAINDNPLGSLIQSSWCAKLTSADFFIGQWLQPCECFTVKPYVGVKWARIKQQQAINYGRVGSGNNALTASLSRCNNFSGAGPEIGIDGSLSLDFYYFNIIGSTYGALLYGPNLSKTHYLLTPSSNPINITPNVIACKKHLHPMIQMMLGLSWEKDCDCVDIELAVAYEAQYWWNQWQNPNSIANTLVLGTTSGNFMTNGLTMRMGFRF